MERGKQGKQFRRPVRGHGDCPKLPVWPPNLVIQNGENPFINSQTGQREYVPGAIRRVNSDGSTAATATGATLIHATLTIDATPRTGIDPSQPGYPQIIEKIGLHEIGHTCAGGEIQRIETHRRIRQPIPVSCQSQRWERSKSRTLGVGRVPRPRALGSHSQGTNPPVSHRRLAGGFLVSSISPAGRARAGLRRVRGRRGGVGTVGSYGCAFRCGRAPSR